MRQRSSHPLVRTGLHQGVQAPPDPTDFATPGLLYGSLSAATLWPLVQASSTAMAQNDFATVMALGGIAANLGVNILSHEIVKWKESTEAEVAAELAHRVEADPALLEQLDLLMAELQTVTIVAESIPDQSTQERFLTDLHAELTQLGNLPRYEQTFSAINSGSGVAQQGHHNIAAGAGGFAARTHTGPVTIINNPPADPKATQREGWQRYLQKLGQRCNVLPISPLGGDETAGDEVTLDQVYVDLDTTTTKPVSEEDKKKAKDREHVTLSGEREEGRLSALEIATRHKRLVLLGDPGSGKSTFARQMVAWLTEAIVDGRTGPPQWDAGLVPIFTVLRDVTPHLAALKLEGMSAEKRDSALVQAVWDQWQENLDEMKAATCAEQVEKALTAGTVLVIFDGLDEVPVAMRPRVRDMIRALLRTYPHIQRMLITCRIRSYVGSAQLPGFASHTLAPFSNEKIAQFIQAWYGAQVKLERLRAAQAKKRVADLRGAALSDELQELASNPMLLTTMAIIHQREVGLPKQRVMLYELAVEVLLHRWQQRKGLVLSSALADLLADQLKMRTVLEGMAHAAHAEKSKQEADLPRSQLLTLLEDKDYLGDLGLAGEFLDYVDQRAGLLVGRGGDVDGQKPQTYAFPHRTFQEYLAGCFLMAGRNSIRKVWQRTEEGDYWTLAVQLGAEELLYNRKSPEALLDLTYGLAPVSAPTTEAQWRAAVWSGQMAVVAGKIAVQTDHDVPEGGQVYLNRLLPRLLDVMRASPLPALERAEAGRVLAKLGDPRIEVLDPFKMAWRDIPAGPFLMGSKDDPLAFDYEKPQFTYTLDHDFKIGRFPVTVAQYRAFVDAGGYGEVRYWEEAKKAGYWKDGQVKGQYDNAWRAQPETFSDPFQLDNHPVVGVSWYEALAYSRWLDEQREQMQPTLPKGWQIRLPTEAEWEKAARGVDGGIEPWGGQEPDPDRCNFDQSKIGSTSAVGCFPGGTGPFGVEEAVGNVWEWTLTKWSNDYKDYARSEDNGIGSEGRRVVRGGSWLNLDQLLRPAARFSLDPVVGYNDVGFRLVASPYL